MKASLKFFRCSIVLLLALTVAFSAAVGVSADTIEPELVIFRANANKAIQTRFSLNTLYTMTYPDAAYMGLFAEIPLEADTTYVMNITIHAESINDYSDDIVYLASLPQRVTTWSDSGNLINVANVHYNKTQDASGGIVQYIINLNTANLTESDLNTYLYLISTGITSGMSTEFKAVSIECICTYDPNSDIMIEISNKLDTIINNQNNQSNNVIVKLNQIISNQEIQNNNWQTLITYGNNYNQIEQTLINNLGSAEDQLSSAEGALENKSKSLMQQAAAGISKATTASQTLVSSITTTIPKVYNFASDIIEVTPPEVQAAVLAIPLLSFAIWLIGLRR